MSKDKRKVDDDIKLVCEPVDDMEKFNKKYKDRKIAEEGVYKEHKSPKLENTATDVYYQTECKLPESEVAIPTYDSVLEAKEWVDDVNKK